MSVNVHDSRCACELCCEAANWFPQHPLKALAEAPSEETITLTRAELQEELERAYRRGVAEAGAERDLRPIEAGEAT